MYIPPGLKLLAERADAILGRWRLPAAREENALIVFYLHGIIDDRRRTEVDPSDQLSRGFVRADDFRRLVTDFLARGYTFVSPDDILKGLGPGGKYVMMTFDDGYWNNQYCLPVLNEFRTPAVFFIAPGYIIENRCFWWDVVCRERRKSGASARAIAGEIDALKRTKIPEIENYITTQFGSESFRPQSDAERPFTVAELKDFARCRYVVIGNHTYHHANLSICTDDEIRQEIRSAQDALEKMTGEKPVALSYPGGKYRWAAVETAEELGLQMALTIDPSKNFLPLGPHPENRMLLGRFALFGDRRSLERQCIIARSGISMRRWLKRFLSASAVQRRS